MSRDVTWPGRIAIIGTPGSGKTTLAAALSAEFDLPTISAGDIARRVDPGAIARGEMADMDLLAGAIAFELSDSPYWIIEGFPRTHEQAQMLPPGVVVIHLTVRPDIARERLLRRGRSDDDTIEKRITEQTALMEVDYPDGWAWKLAGYGRSLNTDRIVASQVARQVSAHLRGEKVEVY